MVKMHMMRQKGNTVVMNVTKLFLSVVTRSVLIYFFIANIIGIVWFMGTLDSSSLIRGLIFSLSSFIVGISPLNNFKGRIANRIYLTICLFGILSSLYLCVKNFLTEYGTSYDFSEQLIIILCFIIMMVRKISAEKEER